jgi:hypothetical protein
VRSDATRRASRATRRWRRPLAGANRSRWCWRTTVSWCTARERGRRRRAPCAAIGVGRVRKPTTVADPRTNAARPFCPPPTKVRILSESAMDFFPRALRGLRRRHNENCAAHLNRDHNAATNVGRRCRETLLSSSSFDGRFSDANRCRRCRRDGDGDRDKNSGAARSRTRIL